MTLQRIVVVGTTGSGKTTMAGRLAARLNIPHVEQDALNWGPNWTMRPNKEFRALVDQKTTGKQWVVDGNYSRSRDLVWPREWEKGELKNIFQQEHGSQSAETHTGQ